MARKPSGKVKPKGKKPTPRKAAKPVEAALEPEEAVNLGGRPTRYTKALGLAVCTHIANGLSLRAIGELPGMPAKTTVLEWALDDREGFRTIYMRARSLQLESEADEIVEIADDGKNDYQERKKRNGEPGYFFDKDHIERSKLRVATRQWRLTKLDTKKYGEKAEVKHDGTDAFLKLWKHVGAGDAR